MSNSQVQVVQTVYALKNQSNLQDRMLFKTMGKDAPFDGGTDDYIYIEGNLTPEDGITVIRHKNNGGSFISLNGVTKENLNALVASNLSTVEVANYTAQALAARDAALIQAGVYATEAAGRAAVADGQYFKVQGSGNVAAYEYKRTNSTTSVLVATYPSKNYVDLKTPAAVGKNLFNYVANDVAIGYFPSNTTGVLQANATYNTTGFIPVLPSTNYTVSSKHYWAWYDSANVFISGTSSSNTNKTQTSPANAAYMRASILASAWTTLQVELGSTQTTFEAYGVFLDTNFVKDRSLPKSKLGLKSVDIEQTKFLKTGKNLFNKGTVTTGYILGHDGSAPTVNATYDYSDYIPVSPSTTYTSNYNMRFTTFYGANYEFIAGGSSTSTSTITTPSTVYFVRVTMTHANLAAFQLEAGASSTVFEAYTYKILGDNNEPLSVPASALPDSSITRAKVNFLPLGKNKFNKATVTTGYFLGPTGTATASGTYDYSDYIAVNVGTTYTSNNDMRFTCYYDSSFNVVAGGSSTAITSFTVPSGVAYVRITLADVVLSAYQLEIGTSATGYEAYGYYLDALDGVTIYTASTSNKSTWNGKKWATLGDSITSQATWQSYVVAKYGLILGNYGVGGTKISGSIGDVDAMCQATRVNAIPTETDVINMAGGTNDWAQSVPLGTINSTDPLTFYGAVNIMLSKVFARFPTARLTIMTTPYGEMPARLTDGSGWPNAYTNLVGLTTADYAEAIRQCAKKWGVTLIDVFQNAGWNTINLATYLTNDGNLLHPNATGGKRVSELVIAKLKELEPVA